MFAATHDKIRWQGWTVRDDAAGTVKYAYAGVRFHFTVSRTGQAHMVYSSTFPQGLAELRVYVDGKLASNITLRNSVPTATPATVLLVDGLARTRSHNISGIYITDPITLQLETPNPWSLADHAQMSHGFSTDGEILTQPPIAPTQRRLDIYGDSITAGNQIDPESCQPDYAGTYGRLLCDDFAANCTCAAISGKGIFKNCCDKGAKLSPI